MTQSLTAHYAAELESIQSQGLFKAERVITSPQSAEIQLADGRKVLNFCANNYLGLADHPDIIQAAKDALDTHGFGMASVRFICGTQDLHKQLEATIADLTPALQLVHLAPANCVPCSDMKMTRVFCSRFFSFRICIASPTC